MAAFLDFVSAREQRQLSARLARTPRLAATWTLTDQGRLVCAWHEQRLTHGPAELASADEAAVQPGQRLAA